uniref:Ribonuclease H-like domain-containing protein n=1 Tax=Tanacetum cinerariifolium TaxID=118510 RepID=A0A6L2JNZ9_TANCI|nr:ribonuclease H-like domain-containing protein [Tanacetum cinerariifolium]
MTSLASVFKDLGSDEKDGLLSLDTTMVPLPPRKRSCVITNENKRFLVVVGLGGLFDIRNQIDDAVVIARILEASLVLSVLIGDERQRMMDDALEKVVESSIETQSTSERTYVRSKHKAECTAVDRQRALEKAVSQKTAVVGGQIRKKRTGICWLQRFYMSIDERALQKREYDIRVTERLMQSKEGKVDLSKALNVGLIVTESNETELERHVSSSRSRKDIHAEDAYIVGFKQYEDRTLVAPTTAKQRLARKNELKARGTLLMALLDKHQLKFNTHKDAKSLMEAIEKQFGGNKKANKVQKTLLKQQYENFTGSSSESLDHIHDRLQKLISQLEILGESLSQEDVNLTLKIYEAEVKSSSSTSHTTQNIAFVSSQNTDNTNESVIDVPSVSAASTKVLVSTLPNVDTLSDDMAMLTMRARGFLQRTGRNLGANGTKSIGFDMSKAECYNCHRRGHFTRECRSPKDTRNKETQRRNVPAEEEPTNYALMAFTSSSSSSSDNKVASCSKTNTKAYATLQSHYDKLTNDLRKSQFDVFSYKIGLKSVEARILVYQQNETVFEEDIKLLKLDVMLRDNALVDLRKEFKKVEQERDELKLKLDKFQTSLKNLSQLLASQTFDKIGLGYDNQVFNSIVFDCDEIFSSESDVSMPTSSVFDRYKSGEGYHVVPPLYTGTFMPSKPDLFFHDAPTVNEIIPTIFNNASSFVQTSKHVKSPRPSIKLVKHPIPVENLRKDIPKSRDHKHSRNRKACFVCKNLTHLIKDCDYYEKKMVQKPVRNHAIRGNHQHYAWMTHPNPQRHVVPTSVLTRSRLVPLTATGPVTTVATQVNVVQGVNENWDNPQHALKDKGVIDSGKGKIRTWKLDFDDVYFVKELKFNLFSVSQMCDKKKNVIFTDTEYIVLSSDFKLPDENHVLLRVPRENNMYNVDLKNIVPSGDLTCLFAKATLNEFNIWHRRLGHINFKTMNKLVKGNLVRGLPSKVFENNHTCVACKKGKQHRASCKFDRKVDEGVLVGYSISSKAFRVFNSRTRIVQETLHINFLENQPNVAGSGPTWLFDIDTLTKSINYQPIIAGNQPNPSAAKEPEFTVHVSPSICDKAKKHNDKSKREAKRKSPVELSTGVRNLSEEFEDFCDNIINEVNAGSTPVFAVRQNSTNSTNTFSATALEDITYSGDEEDVSAEAGFSNLETNITASPILTTKVQKDHHVTQIIGDLSLAPQTRSMTRMVKEQEPKRVHKALKDPSWIQVMHEELLQFKMQKIDVKSAFLYGTIEEKVYVCQPPGFEDSDYPDKVYKVVKALYGLHQDPKAWYETLSNYLLENGFQRGKIDQTLFIKKQKGNILLVQTNDVVRLQALIDRRNVIITEDTVRQALRLDDAESIDCLSNEKIFAELARMGLVRNVDSSSKLYMVAKGFSGVDTPLFEGMLVPQVQDDIDVANDVANVFNVVATDAEPTPPSPTPTITPSPPQQEVASTSPPSPHQSPIAHPSSPPQQQPSHTTDISMDLLNTFWKPLTLLLMIRRMHPNRGKIAELDADEDVTLKEVVAEVPKDVEVQGRLEESQAQVYHLDLEHADKVISMQDDKAELAELKEVIEVVTTAKLMTEVVTVAATTITAAPSAARRIKGVVIRDPKEIATPSVVVYYESKSKDKGKGILVEESKPLKKQAQIELDEAYAREEELEMLWQIVQARFASSKTKNFSDDFLMNTLKTMFEKPNVEAHIWKSQRGSYGLAKVKS